MATSNAEYRVSTYKYNDTTQNGRITTTDSEGRTVKASFSDSNNIVKIQSTAANELVTSLSSIATDLSTATSNLANLSTSLQLVGVNVSNAFSDTGQYEDLVDTAADAATNYINSKIQRIKNAWNTQVSVSIGSLIGAVAPYAKNPETIGDELSSKMTKLVGYLTGTGSSNSWEDVLKNIGTDVTNQLGLSSITNLSVENMTSGIGTDGYNALDYLKSSGAIGSAISNLSAVQAYGQVFNAVSDVIKIVKRIKNIIETLKPTLSIATNLASTWCTGGASAAEASNIIVEECQKKISDIEILVLYAIKKLVFSIKIKLPALLVGAIDSISIRDAMLDLPDQYSWITALFNDQFFADVEYTLQWGEAIKSAVNSVKNAVTDVQDSITSWEKLVFKNSSGEIVNRGQYMKETFMSTLTSTYMNSVVVEAHKVAYIPDYTQVSWSDKTNTAQYTPNIESYSSSLEQSLDKILADDSEQNPITDIYAVMNVSKTLYNNIIG